MYSLDNYAQFQATTHPFLEAMAVNPYGNTFQARGNNHHQRPHSNFKAAFRPLAAAGTNFYDSFSSGGTTGYGPSSSGWDQHQPQSAHSGYGHSGPTGTGYAAPHPQTYSHPPERPSSSFGFGKLKKGGNSAMTALTLLSFFFFVNLLQSCLKEQMSAMNPTVMVMTNGVVRNRSNKLAEMNSREHSNSATLAATDGHIVIQPEDLVSAAGSVMPMTVAPTITLQSPYSIGVLNQQSSTLESHLKLQNPYATPSTTVDSMAYDSPKFDYPNRTMTSDENQRPQHHYEHDDRHYASNVFSPQHEISDAYPWQHGSGSTSASSSSSSSSSSTHNRYGSPYSASPSHSYYDDRNHFYERDRYGDRYFTKVY